MFTTVDNNETSPHNSETQNQPQIDRTTSEEKIEANDKLIVDDIDDSINMKLPELGINDAYFYFLTLKLF